MTTSINEWIDKNGLVKPRKDWVDSGNGITYSSIASILNLFDSSMIASVGKAMASCFKKPGLLMRTPDNQFGQESWDDYFSIACLFVYAKSRKTSRDILKYGFTHFFFFNNLDEFSWKSFLGRFPQVWVMMFIAAFPWMKWPLYPALFLIQLTFKQDVNDASGFQLEWLFLRTCNLMGFKFKKYEIARSGIKQAWATYYDSDHPFQSAEV